jgi:hypothetical protein
MAQATSPALPIQALVQRVQTMAAAMASSPATMAGANGWYVVGGAVRQGFSNPHAGGGNMPDSPSAELKSGGSFSDNGPGHCEGAPSASAAGAGASTGHPNQSLMLSP